MTNKWNGHLHLMQKRKLQDFDGQDNNPNLAEASHPRCEPKQDIKNSKQDTHTHGRKPTENNKKAKRMNWTLPLIWSQIDAAA